MLATHLHLKNAVLLYLQHNCTTAQLQHSFHHCATESRTTPLPGSSQQQYHTHTCIQHSKASSAHAGHAAAAIALGNGALHTHCVWKQPLGWYGRCQGTLSQLTMTQLTATYTTEEQSHQSLFRSHTHQHSSPFHGRHLVQPVVGADFMLCKLLVKLAVIQLQH